MATYIERFSNDFELSNLPELLKDEIYISHVGDHEYSFNIFGSAHTDQVKFFQSLADHFHCKTTDFEVYSSKDRKNEYTIILNKNKYRVAVLTIEKIDPDKFPIIDS